MTCGDIPLPGRAEPRIEVRLPLGKAAEFERRAAGNALAIGQPREQRIGRRIGMGPADKHHGPLGRQRPRPNRRARRGGADRSTRSETQALREPGPCGPPAQPKRRRCHNAEHRDAFPHERDIDRELIPPCQQFACAVKRIDQDEGILAAAGIRAPGGLLRDHRNPRQQPCQSLQDDGFGRLIGCRDRRMIGFCARLERAGADCHNRGSGPRHQGRQVVQQDRGGGESSFIVHLGFGSGRGLAGQVDAVYHTGAFALCMALDSYRLDSRAPSVESP